MSAANRIAWLVVLGVFAFVALGCIYGKVAFSPDGRRMASVVYGDAPRPATPGEEEDVGAAAAGEEELSLELWVTDVESGEHSFVTRGEIVGVSPAWSPDGRALWFLRGGDAKELQLVRWDGTAVAVVADVPLRGDAQAFAIWPPQPLPDGSAVLFTDTLDEVTGSTDEENARIVRWDVAEGRTTVFAANAAGAVVSPRGDLVAFLSWPPGSDDQEPLSLCVAPVEGGGERRVVARLRERLADLAFSPLAWSPDGSRLAWIDGTDPQPRTDHMTIHVADVLAGGLVRRVSPPDASAWCPVWSTDGEELWFSAQKEKRSVPFVRRVRLRDGDVLDLEAGAGCVTAGISPDGRTLALRRCFVEASGGLGKVSVVRLVDLATGAFRDDWITVAQRRAAVRAELAAVEHEIAAAAAAARRAELELAALEEQFPGSTGDAAVTALRERLARLRDVGLHGERVPPAEDARDDDDSR